MASGDGGRDIAFKFYPGGEQCKRGKALELGVPADRESMRGGGSDANAGEAPRSHSDEETGRAPARHQLRNHRDQPFGMATPDDLIGATDATPSVVEQGGRAGGARGVECEQHVGNDSGHKRRAAATPRVKPWARRLRRFRPRARSAGSGFRCRASGSR